MLFCAEKKQMFAQELKVLSYLLWGGEKRLNPQNIACLLFDVKCKVTQWRPFGKHTYVVGSVFVLNSWIVSTAVRKGYKMIENCARMHRCMVK